MNTLTYARTAGLLYLIIAVFGVFAIGYVPSVIIEAGDAIQTASNLKAHATLFSFGIVADVVVILVEVVLTAMLYVMFKPVNPTLALIAAWSRFAMVLVMAVNLLINIMPVLLISDASYLSAFDSATLQATALLFFDAHALGIYVWQLFFGLHLIALGYMVVKSDLVPKAFGWMMGIGSFGYSLQGLAKITDYDTSFVSVVTIGLLVVVTIGELAFALWLLTKGVKSQ